MIRRRWSSTRWPRRHHSAPTAHVMLSNIVVRRRCFWPSSRSSSSLAPSSSSSPLSSSQSFVHLMRSRTTSSATRRATQQQKPTTLDMDVRRWNTKTDLDVQFNSLLTLCDNFPPNAALACRRCRLQSLSSLQNYRAVWVAASVRDQLKKMSKILTYDASHFCQQKDSFGPDDRHDMQPCQRFENCIRPLRSLYVDIWPLWLWTETCRCCERVSTMSEARAAYADLMILAFDQLQCQLQRYNQEMRRHFVPGLVTSTFWS